MTHNDNQTPVSEKKLAMEAAIEAFMTDEFNETVMLDGYILQASGLTVSTTKTSLVFAAKDDQSPLISVGLQQYADYNVQNLAFGIEDQL